MGGPNTVIFHCKANHATESAHLFFRNLMIGMVLESAPDHFIHPGLSPQPPGDLFAILTMPLHADMQRFQPAKHQKAILRTWNSTGAVLNKSQLLMELFIVHNKAPVNRITVTADIF